MNQHSMIWGEKIQIQARIAKCMHSGMKVFMQMLPESMHKLTWRKTPSPQIHNQMSKHSVT